MFEIYAIGQIKASKKFPGFKLSSQHFSDLVILALFVSFMLLD